MAANIVQRKTSGGVVSIAITVVFGLLVVLNLLPLVWGVLTSFKGELDLFRFPPSFIHFTPTLVNYERVYASGFFGSIGVSLAYSAAAVVLVLVLALPAAYAFDRFEFPLRRPLFLLIVSCIPLSIGAAALLIPNYIAFSAMHMTNTWFVLPLIYAAHQLPMGIWIIKGMIESIPKELDEAAIIDGASTLDILRHVILPVAGPAFGAAAILTFVGAWNEFVAGSVMVDTPALKPVQPVIYAFIGFFGREWGPLTASATLAIVPVIIVFALFGRLMVSGLTKGSVKG
ncbi:MAG: carbohydrate ABC transporter permease [Betaproteobacteria bacterium]